MNHPTLKDLCEEARTFLQPFRSIVLSTIDKQNQPHASYAPHIMANQCLYVFVSALAKHSESLAQGEATVLFLQDEYHAKNIFARKRLTLLCTTVAIERSHKINENLLDAFEQQHGNTVKVLRQLPDFQMYQLKPTSAWYVTGFGAAFDLSEDLSTLLS